MIQCLRNALVAVFELNVLAHQTYANTAFGIFVALQKIFPSIQICEGIATIHTKFTQDHLVKPFLLHEQGHIIDGVGVDAFNDCI